MCIIKELQMHLKASQLYSIWLLPTAGMKAGGGHKIILNWASQSQYGSQRHLFGYSPKQKAGQNQHLVGTDPARWLGITSRSVETSLR